MRKVDLIIHPVRFRILQTLVKESLTTQEIAIRLPDVPKSSIYRHLKTLLDGGLLSVSKKRLVKGIQEKTYTLVETLHLDADDMAGLSAASHMRYFTTYIMTVLQGFADYLEAAEAEGEAIDMLADRAGYTEVMFYANKDELNAFQAAVNEAFLKVMNNEAGDRRRKHKFALVTHPVTSFEEQDDE